MLASITPLGERGRGQRWPITVVAFALGATAAGVALGAVLGALGTWLDLTGWAQATRLAVLAGVLAAGTLLDATRRVPGPRRQVDGRWLDEFRGWVYGIDFGAQLGAGLVTVITSAATWCAVTAALLSGSAAVGAAITGLYGLIRGVTPAATARVRNPGALFALHGRLDRWRAPVHGGVTAGLGLLALAAAVGAAV